MEAAILIYDGECPVCRGARDWIAAHSRPGAFRFVPCQDPARAEIAPQVAYEDCMREIYVLLPDGRVSSGAAAFQHILARLGRYRWLRWIFRVPGALILAPPLYRLFARNRMTVAKLAGLDGCKSPRICQEHDQSGERRT